MGKSIYEWFEHDLILIHVSIQKSTLNISSHIGLEVMTCFCQLTGCLLWNWSIETLCAWHMILKRVHIMELTCYQNNWDWYLDPSMSLLLLLTWISIIIIIIIVIIIIISLLFCCCYFYHNSHHNYHYHYYYHCRYHHCLQYDHHNRRRHRRRRHHHTQNAMGKIRFLVASFVMELRAELSR